MWNALRVSIDDQEVLDNAKFTVTTVEDENFIEVTFSHGGGLSRGASLHIGYLRNGKARAGDGMELGDVSRDVKVVIFDRERIDTSTIDADFPCGISSGTTVALFIVWRSQPDLTRVLAAGLSVTYEHTSGFQIGSPIYSGDAVDFLMEAEMVLEGGFAPISPISEGESSHFTELWVEGYRGFAQRRRLRLARPSGSPGSGLTVLVGANNSGKSTFLEAFHAIARARNQPELNFPQPRRHRDTDAVRIELIRSDGRSVRVETIRAGGSQAKVTWLPQGSGPDRFDIQVTPSRRQFSPYFGNTGSADRNWGLHDQEFSRTQLREQFVGRLRKVDRDPDARLAFDGLLKRIVGTRLDWTIDEIATGQQFLKLIEVDGAWHTSEGLGDGLVSLLFIVDALYDSEPDSLIAIDEPELSLHPQLIRRLGRILSEYAADRQVVVATHSPVLFDWSDVANGASVARVYKADGRSEIAQASDETLQKVSRLADSRNLSNPHTVGTVAREALFLEDGVILTEGQDDVSYLPRVFEELGLARSDNLYGWGSGGVGNIPLLAQLFIELGFSRIGAILDDDGQPGTVAALAKLSSMAPEVLVRQIPAPDIRYKKTVESKPEVIGLLDRENHVRADLRDAAIIALEEVLGHVSPS